MQPATLIPDYAPEQPALHPGYGPDVIIAGTAN